MICPFKKQQQLKPCTHEIVWYIKNVCVCVWGGGGVAYLYTHIVITQHTNESLRQHTRFSTKKCVVSPTKAIGRNIMVLYLC